MPRFSQLIAATATQDPKTQQMAPCFKSSCLQLLEMLQAEGSQLSRSLGTALGRLTHNHTPFLGAACSRGLGGKGNSETQPLFPQLRAALKGHCCSRGPRGTGWGLGVTTWHPSFSLGPVLFPLLSHRNRSQGYSPLQK